MTEIGRLATSDSDEFSFEVADPPRGRIGAFVDARRDRLQLNGAQKDAVRRIKRAIEDARRTGKKHVVVLEGPQGSGKTLVALALVSSQLQGESHQGAPARVQLLMQGQTKDQWHAKLPEAYQRCIDSWSGRKWVSQGPHELVIADEVHLMLPLGTGNARAHTNNLDRRTRLETLVRQLGEPHGPVPCTARQSDTSKAVSVGCWSSSGTKVRS